MNKTSAKEWLEKAWHNLSGAKVLYEVNHYTDITAIELHYAVEKILKSFLAYENKKIPKTHDLVQISKLIDDKINLEEDFLLLKQITKYHREAPSKEEIKEVMDFTYNLLDKVCNILDINKEDLI
ncbi:MAG: HEPN domain-containing protein [Campylobacterales bacterium]